jgi:hypothetical protein
VKNRDKGESVAINSNTPIEELPDLMTGAQTARLIVRTVEPEWMKQADFLRGAAARWGVGQRTVQGWIDAKLIESRKIGGVKLIRVNGWGPPESTPFELSARRLPVIRRRRKRT